MHNEWPELYRLQDWALDVLRSVDHSFYLTGGTALSRGYYEHRYSEDLDFFTNDQPEFTLWRDRCIEALRQAADAKGYGFDITVRDERFGRAFVRRSVPLKLEFINDVPCRIGVPWPHPHLGQLDTKENILANKISALVDRASPKDKADMYWLCCRDTLDCMTAIEQAEGKASGIFPPLVAKALLENLSEAWSAIVWKTPPDRVEFEQALQQLAKQIML